MTHGLTPLERELIDYVERLAVWFESSQQELTDLGERSTRLTAEVMGGMQQCMELLVQSQMELNASFQAYLTASESFDQLDERLSKSLALLSVAEAKLNE